MSHAGALLPSDTAQRLLKPPMPLSLQAPSQARESCSVEGSCRVCSARPAEGTSYPPELPGLLPLQKATGDLWEEAPLLWGSHWQTPLLGCPAKTPVHDPASCSATCPGLQDGRLAHSLLPCSCQALPACCLRASRWRAAQTRYPTGVPEAACVSGERMGGLT